MGMLDFVKFEMPCPHCGTKVDGFQTKSGACMMHTLSPAEAHNFYSSCSNCHAWLECEYVPPAGTGVIKVCSGIDGGDAKTAEIPWDSDAD